MMKFSEKYEQLKNPAKLEKLVINSVYGTMALEGQTVPKDKIAQFVKNLLKKRRL